MRVQIRAKSLAFFPACSRCVQGHDQFISLVSACWRNEAICHSLSTSPEIISPVPGAETVPKNPLQGFCSAAAVTTQLRFGNVSCSCGRYPLVLTALLIPLRLFTSTDVCKHPVQCCPWLKYRSAPLLSAGFFRTKVTRKEAGKEPDVSYTNWAQISAERKKHEVTEHHRVPRIVSTHT